MIEGYRAARRESWGMMDFADAAAEHGDTVDDYYYDEAYGGEERDPEEDSGVGDEEDEEAEWLKQYERYENDAYEGYGEYDDDEEEVEEEYYGDYRYSNEGALGGSLSDTVLRRRFGIALKGTAVLFRQNLIDAVHKAALKELILRADKRVLAAVEVYEADQDDAEILDTLRRIARRGVAELSGY